jgi:predicted amidohydrolase
VLHRFPKCRDIITPISPHRRRYGKHCNLAQAEQWIREAAGQGGKLVLIPEASVQGYVRVSFPVGSLTNALNFVPQRAKILAVAETIPGPAASGSGFQKAREGGEKDEC